MSALDPGGRAALERATVKARQVLERDLSQFAEGRLGIYRDGRLESEEALHLERDSSPGRAAVERLIREAAFTHLNRLVAIRIAEQVGLLPESLTRGRSSRGFRDVLEVAPLLSQDETGGYWTYLRLCADELAGDAPVLFDPRNPLLALAPSAAAVDELLDVLNDSSLAEVWGAADALGWLYQFFNTGEERRRMREESGAPRDSRELAVRNQFFTPGYVVGFLVQNSLGRRLIEAGVASGLEEALPLLTDIPDAGGSPLALDKVQVLDPACGSGHFLLGCYDVLERAWALSGVDAAAAAERILPCLWGVDIDPRCAQVAAAALVLRARRAARDADLPRPRVITARALPDDPEAWGRALKDMSEDRQRLVRAVQEALRPAPILGPLLKAEELLETEIRRAVPEAQAEGTLFAAMGVADDAFGQAETDVLAAVQQVADSVESTAAERLLAAEAADAIRFVEAMRNRYDAVLMNPPFGEPVPETKGYLKAAYPWIPTRDYNLLAAFVGRGLELCREGGYVGAITSRAGMFLTTFEKWRREVLLGHRLVALADLGYGVMEQAMVEAAAYVLSSERADDASASTYVRLLRESDRGAALADAIETLRRREDDPRVFELQQDEFEAVPGAPLSYWMAPEIRRLFRELPALEGNGAEARQGLATGDDFRFVRAFWEVRPDRIARGREETRRGRRWVPFAKGGEYSPYWADIHLLVDWQDDGRALRDSSGSRVQNEQHYFRPGLTWPLRTQGGFNPRVLPGGCIFGHKGPAVLPARADPWDVLAWLQSRPLRVMLDAVATFGAYEVGAVQRMPWPGSRLSQEQQSALSKLAQQIVAKRAAWDQADETSRLFVRPGLLGVDGPTVHKRVAQYLATREAATISMLEAVEAIEEILGDALGLGEAARRYLDQEIGDLATRRPSGQLDERESERIADLYAQSSPGGGAGSFVFDPLLEGVAKEVGKHPAAIAEARSRLGVVPDAQLRTAVRDVVSYLVGVAFGRWDLRVARDASFGEPLSDLLQPLPIRPPGMLHAADGAVPDDYPIALPRDGLLLDERGDEWDLEASIRRAAGALDELPLLDDIEAALGRVSLRDYLRSGFFQDHLRRYSRSRRKAPIYWQLSVPSRDWGVWVYAATLSRETLFAVARHAARHERLGREHLEALVAERDAGGRGRTVKEVGDLVAREESLLRELADFRAEVERVAALGWEPNLDDGLILCAAPLANLFPAWPDAAKERTKLKAGAYEWASVSRWSDRL
jgi:hypothetical protein